jgi:hypothetical protein
MTYRRILAALALLCALIIPAHAQSPIVILTSGQSNFEFNPSFAWSPNAGAQIWNGGREGVTGSAYTALDGSTIILPSKLASDIATANPGRPICLINVVQSGTSITHWIQPTAAPDVFQTILNNVPNALAACGATKIDLFAWWQGESDTPNAAYVSSFATLTSQLWAQSWFPQETPMLIFGIASTAQSSVSTADKMNNLLQSIVNVDPAKRKFVYPADLVGTTYWLTAPNLHMTGQGYFSAGALASAAYTNGTRRTNPPSLIVDPATGNTVFGKPAYAAVPFLFNQNNNLTPPNLVGAGSLIEQFVGADGDTPQRLVDTFGGFSVYTGRRANGTSASPTALLIDDIIVSFAARGHDGSVYSPIKGSLIWRAAENWTASPVHRGTYASLFNTVAGSDTINETRFTPGCITFFGVTSGSLGQCVPAVAGSSLITWPVGTTDFTATGPGFLKQAATGGSFTVIFPTKADVGLGSVPNVDTTSAGNISSGTLATARGGVNLAAWTPYSPSLVSSIPGGTPATYAVNKARYWLNGKTVTVTVDISVTNQGVGAAGTVNVDLPFAAAVAAATPGSSFEYFATGKSGFCYIGNGATQMKCADATNTTYISTGKAFVGSATYEIP